MIPSPNSNYFAAPQTTNNNGLIVGHSHVVSIIIIMKILLLCSMFEITQVVEKLASLDSTQPLDPTNFAYVY